MTNTIPDIQQRQAALDPERSFIIQAPAGSGKTELLTQRFLVLLSQVQAPEEIIAITFTRKAANEMRQRIINALQAARQPAPETNSHQHTTWQLAHAALQHDQQLNWQLLLNPNRLRIITIDSLCASLASQMPIMAKFGAQPRIESDASFLYELAADQTLAGLESDEVWAEALAGLLMHLDNNYPLVKQLLCDMLAKRDQWLPTIMQHQQADDLRDYLEHNLQQVIEQSLRACDDYLSTDIKQNLSKYLHFAQQQLDKLHDEHVLSRWPSNHWPGTDHKARRAWQALANILLTDKGSWRKSLTKHQGFPAVSDKSLNAEEKIVAKNMKADMLALLEQFSEQQALQLQLSALRHLPPPYYPDSQWHILLALLQLLPISVAQLQLAFQQHGAVDFAEVAIRALDALGEIDNPSDLNLMLDYKIQHLLIDEFQDTSHSQYQLLERLTAGWQDNDGRSLFLVGDPMQSIYRFRQAEVGLFLQAAAQGIGDIKLYYLRLQMNFRSQARIIDWLNQQFPHIFPKQDDQTVGGVSYAAAIAAHAATEQQINYYADGDETQAVQRLIQIIQQIQHEQPNESMALLVKSRSHLQTIIPALNAANMPFDAIDIESLAKRTVIQDLTALTKALLHRADRIAWLSVLRAPYCGLCLPDLLSIAEYCQQQCIWDGLQAIEQLDISDDGKQRLQQFLTNFRLNLANVGRVAVSHLVRQTWLSVGGPATVSQARDLTDAERFFELLQKLEQRGDINNTRELEQQVAKLFASQQQTTANALQIMTIHKAKGLEFDHVFMPFLEKRDAVDSHQLLAWMQRPNLDSEQHDLLLAPIKARSDSRDPIYYYLQQQEKLKQYYERQRLFYVAVTRAKQSLHLMACINVNNDKVKKPSSQSFLSLLWSEFEPLTEHISASSDDEHGVDAISDNKLYRLNHLPHIETYDQESIEATTIHATDTLENHDNLAARLTGIVIHRLLEQFNPQANLPQLLKQAQTALLQLGLAQDDLPTALKHVKQAYQHVISDERGQWLLQAHRDSHNEYALTVYQEDQYHNYIIDRCFIAEDDTRWIIDFKSAQPHAEQTLSDFLHAQQQQYLTQLNNYATCFANLESRPIQLALYFPLVKQGFIAWPYKPA